MGKTRDYGREDGTGADKWRSSCRAIVVYFLVAANKVLVMCRREGVQQEGRTIAYVIVAHTRRSSAANNGVVNA